jgi:thiosulfate dehydrogenase
MKKSYQILACFVLVFASFQSFISCSENKGETASVADKYNSATDTLIRVDTTQIPNDKFGAAVRYGRALMFNTAYYIGPNGINGKYLGNKMNCTNCHQDAGTKLFSFNLLASHENYPQYRAREGKILTLAERVNNCVMRPHSGKPLPLDGIEMVAFLSYLKWINSFAPKAIKFKGLKNLEVAFPETAASSERGSVLYNLQCMRCHGANGEGVMRADSISFQYPPLWGASAYQPGSSMHRVIKQAQWLKANMPYDKATWEKPFLTDAEALDLAAFVNDDSKHTRPDVKSFDYPNAGEKAIDYSKGPFVDTFSVAQHKNGPYQPIINYWKEKGLKPVY